MAYQFCVDKFFLSVAIVYENKIISSLWWLFPAFFYQCWLHITKSLKKISNFLKAFFEYRMQLYQHQPKFISLFSSIRLPNQFYFSLSSNFCLQLIGVPLDFFSAVTWNKPGSNKGIAGSLPVTIVFLKRNSKSFFNIYEEIFYPYCKGNFLWLFETFFAWKISKIWFIWAILNIVAWVSFLIPKFRKNRRKH